ALVEFGGVGDVEVAAEREVARRPRASTKIRVTGAEAVTAAGAVAKVSHQQFAAEVELLLHRLGEFRMDLARGDLAVVLGQERLEDPVERIRLHAALAEHEGFTRG